MDTFCGDDRRAELERRIEPDWGQRHLSLAVGPSFNLTIIRIIRPPRETNVLSSSRSHHDRRQVHCNVAPLRLSFYDCNTVLLLKTSLTVRYEIA
jgi:hypothetical protein